MSDLVPKLADKAADALNKAPVDEWAEKALDGALGLLSDTDPPDDDDESVAAIAHTAAQELALELRRKHVRDLEVMTRWGGITALSAFGAGQPSEKILDWIREGATFQERLAFQRGANEELRQAIAQREAAWDSLKATLQAAGKLAVRYLVPFLLAAMAAI